VRGEILELTGYGDGLISGDDGRRYAFDRGQTRVSDALVPGMRVDFVPVDDRATAIIHLAATWHRPPDPPLGPDTDRTTPWGYFVGCLRRYVDGYGRARRKEYWFFVLFQAVILLGLLLPIVGFAVAENGTSGDTYALFAGLFALGAVLVYVGLFLPGLCVLIRRFHDVGLSGWLVLLGLIPYVGGLVTFVITLLPSQPYPNKHGPVPGRATRSTADIFA
jgi:uncharacterized membrane protein YhaH (DUF805 family)